ncbi:MAG: pectate lyase [Promethearchaeia archaeon]
MNRSLVFSYILLILGIFLITGITIIIAIIYPIFITYPFSLDFALPIFIFLYSYAFYFLIYGLIGGKELKGRLENSDSRPNLSKRAALFFALFSLISLFILGFFTANLYFNTYIQNLDNTGYAIMSLSSTALIGGLFPLGYISYESSRSYITHRRDAPRKKHRELSIFHLRKTHFKAFSILLLISGGVGLISFIINPDCNYFHTGFADPAYELPTSHYNKDLDNETLVNQEILQSLEKGLWALTKIRQSGGFAMWAETDGCYFYSDRGFDCPLFPREFSLQEGTALLADLYLDMYQIENNSIYLEVAEEAGEALLAVQDKENGGFYYDGRRYEDGRGYQPHPKNLMRTAILDDNVMQSSLSFLLDLYNETKNQKYLDGFERGFQCLLDIEKPQGGWPQRSNYPDDDLYFYYVTLNDGTLKDIVFVLLKAYRIFPEEERYLNAAKRGCEFLLTVQGNGGSSDQMGWAQQYNDQNQPAWARNFEPLAICSRATVSAMESLLEMYLMTNDTKWIEPIPHALEWLYNSKITWEEEGEQKTGWARFYELKTNKPIYGLEFGRGFIKPYVYEDPFRSGYDFRGQFGIDAFKAKWDYLKSIDYNRTQYKIFEDSPPDILNALETAKYWVSLQTEDGFWLNEDRIRAGTCASACQSMMTYLRTAIK